MTQAVDDPFAEPVAVDLDDPWATSDDVAPGSGEFTPKPYFGDLVGRLIALFPREFVKDAPRRADRVEAGGPTTEQRYTCDMVVLNGGPLTFWYSKRAEDGGEPIPTEYTIPAEEIPFLWTNVWRTEGAVISALRKLEPHRPALLGYVRRGPRSDDRRKGVTIDQIEQRYDEWLARDRRGPEPRFSWVIDVDKATAEDRALASAWLRKAVEGGFEL